ncbi:unnamed protein product [Phytomonas sp. EM1]|nr:unnamed protein product [Phytomonas sp. EM1]|eukprot:CCW65564.1 unnamed protein product [Phytomonas sp. isolate EM1]
MRSIVANTPHTLWSNVISRESHHARHVMVYLTGHFQLRSFQQNRTIPVVGDEVTLKSVFRQVEHISSRSKQVSAQGDMRRDSNDLEQNMLVSTALSPQRKEIKPSASGKVAVADQSLPPAASLVEKECILNSSPSLSTVLGAKSIKRNGIRYDNAGNTAPDERSDYECLNSKHERHLVFQNSNDLQMVDKNNEVKGRAQSSFSETSTIKVGAQPLSEVVWIPKGDRSPSDFSLYGSPETFLEPLRKHGVSHDHMRERRKRSQLALLEPDKCSNASRGAGCSDLLPALNLCSKPEEVLCIEEDDVVLDTPKTLLSMLESPSSPKAFGDAPQTLLVSDVLPHQGDQIQEMVSKQYHSPAARGIGQDVIDLVTDVFTEQRDALIKKRRQVLYAMTHPCASDYTYGNKLVPPPPLSFGKVTDEAVKLGNELLLGQRYFLVNQSGSRADITAPLNSLSSSAASVSRMVEMEADDRIRQKKGRCGHGAATARLPAYRGRAREQNIFRDHRYFFEINELYQEIVLVGKACAGKSSLLNALLGQSVAKTSSLPNTTRQISFYQSVTPEALQAFHANNHHNLVKLPNGGLQLTFVDIPGFGIEGMSDKWRDAAIDLTDAYFGVRRSVNTVLFCIDCDRGLTKTDLKYFQWLENVQGVFFPVLTKCDSVPHSRICSVMRQIYTLITEKRKKYRKVFPFVIPTSSKDGTNIDMLRGLITESSGMIPGDRLRELLKVKQNALMKEALAQESMRLDEAHQIKREQAREQFNLTYTGRLRHPTLPLAPSLSSRSNAEKSNRGPLDLEMDRNGSRIYRLSIRKKDSIPVADQLSLPKIGEGGATIQGLQEDEHRRRGEKFLAWRRKNPIKREGTPYGEVRFRLHTGIDGLDPESIDLTYNSPNSRHFEAPMLSVKGEMKNTGMKELPDAPLANSTHENSSLTDCLYSPTTAAAPPTSLLAPEPSRVVGWPPAPVAPCSAISPQSRDTQTNTAILTPNTVPASQKNLGGPVSHFLDMMEKFSTQKTNTPVKCPSAKLKKLRRKEEKWVKRQAQGYMPPLMVQDESGRLSEFKAGKRCGPSLVSLNTKVDSRQAEWRGKQLIDLLHQHDSESPWSAVGKIAQSIEDEKARAFMKGMRPKDLAAYLRDAGCVTKSFEKFEGEVTSAKYMNEVRQARTLRSREQMHLNATAKINWRSMPPGLWKQYGKADTYWGTSSVLGRENDESHTASYSPQPR